MQENKRFARRYDREFKQSAVALLQSGRSIKEVARDLGVSGWSLRHWIRLAKRGQGASYPWRVNPRATPAARYFLKALEGAAGSFLSPTWGED